MCWEWLISGITYWHLWLFAACWSVWSRTIIICVGFFELHLLLPTDKPQALPRPCIRCHLYCNVDQITYRMKHSSVRVQLTGKQISRVFMNLDNSVATMQCQQVKRKANKSISTTLTYQALDLLHLSLTIMFEYANRYLAWKTRVLSVMTTCKTMCQTMMGKK